MLRMKMTLRHPFADYSDLHKRFRIKSLKEVDLIDEERFWKAKLNRELHQQYGKLLMNYKTEYEKARFK